MLRENERTNWQPETVKNGRYGDWLNNNVDWALSRSRYWGTPLPIWRCEEDHLTCVGSLTELCELTGTDLSGLDPHRPFIDEVTFACRCGDLAVRVPEVIDAWYDSGAMPFAQYGYPYRNKELFERRYPAQFISEAIDQTRGWFYTLMAVGTLVFDKSAYENVVCLGHILAEDGRKMSKHLGNILEPIPLMDQHGADAVRWFMAAVGSPVVGPPGRAHHDAGGRPQDAADVLEHGRLPVPVRPHRRAGRRPRRTRPRPTARSWTAGCCPSCTRWSATWTPRWTRSTPTRPASCCPRSSTTCPTGTSAAAAAASGAATRPRWPPCTRR